MKVCYLVWVLLVPGAFATQPISYYLTLGNPDDQVQLLPEEITPVLWEVHNPTSASITVTQIQPTCGCTSFEWFGNTKLLPGERAWVLTFTERSNFKGGMLSLRLTTVIHSAIGSTIQTSQLNRAVVGTAAINRSHEIVRTKQTIRLPENYSVTQLHFLDTQRRQPQVVTFTQEGQQLKVSVNPHIKRFGLTLFEVRKDKSVVYLPIYSLPH